MPSVPLEMWLPIIIVLFFGIGIHEYAHCKVADMAGDPTPGSYGRVTLNLTKHFEPVGTVLMVFSAFSGYGIGWGRAAPMDPRKMNNPRWDLFAAVAAGPLSNFLQATVYALMIRFAVASGSAASMPLFFENLLIYGVFINIRLMLFNLIPFGPLDGHWLIGQLLPEKQRYYWYKFNRSVGMIGLMAMMIGLRAIANNGGPDVIGAILDPPTEFLVRFLIGAK